MIRRVQLLTIDSGRNTEEVIKPFCPLDIEEGRSKAAKSPGRKADGGGIRNTIQRR
jgi:hypothetical protein